MFLAALVVALPAAARTSGRGWIGLVARPRPSVALAGRDIVVLKTPSLAQRIATLGPATEAQERAWTSQASAAQQQVLTSLAQAGLDVQPDYEYTRVLDGFSARLDPRAVALLQRDPLVAGIFPVRAAYPAAIVSPGRGTRPVTLSGSDGHGVTVALLDTGVDLQSPALRGHVLPGIDAVNGNDDAHAVADPDERTRVEDDGTELAGIVAAAAPGAIVLPVRVAGWQETVDGNDAVYARSDQLVEGLELAVDPNQDGDAHDAARVALVGVAEPYASFTDDAEAQAVQGALDLGTVVVAPAGNEGGSVSGPAAAPAAVAVVASDARAELTGARVVLRTGLNVVYDRVQPLLGARAPSRATVLAVATIGAHGFFDAKGRSLVAGRAVVVPEGADPRATVSAAGSAGAAAVLLYGDTLPAGLLSANVPVALIPEAAARSLLNARAAGYDVGIAIGKGRAVSNATNGFVAPFSSRGLTFDGNLKPDIAAPGVNISSVDGVVTGTGAAAAIVAGAAASIAAARPGLDGAALRSLLVGYAQPGGAAATQTGAGRFRAGAAAVGEVAADQATIGFGVLARGGSVTKTVTLHNASSRRLQVSVRAVTTSGETAPLQFAVSPRVLTLAPGASETVGVTVSSRVRQTSPLVLGAIEAQAVGSETLRIPWVLLLHPPAHPSVRVSVAKTSFAPSDVDPDVLTVRLGSAAAQLSLLLYSASGRYLGALAEVRDVLPGTYAFGITGRGSAGSVLARGGYQVRVVARSPQGATSRAIVPFTTL
ncbi:MAG TPA: S8 family serine peptidase [Gaiellaceae bacterium]